MYFKMHLIFAEKLALVVRWIFHFGKEARLAGQILLWALEIASSSAPLAVGRVCKSIRVKQHQRKALEKSFGEKY